MKKLKVFLIAVFTFLLFMPAKIWAEPAYVADSTNTLTDSEIRELSELARSVSEKHQCGVYVRVIQNYEEVGGSDIYDCAEKIFINQGLGYGSQNTGVLLIIAMDEGYYDICAYGDTANTAFTDYAKGQIEESVVYRLSDEDWYEAFNVFINQADYMLSEAEGGTPVDNPQYLMQVEEQDRQRRAFNRGITFGVPPVISLLTCLGLKSRNKTKFVKRTAHNYIPDDGLRIRRANEHFINRTVVRTPIVRNTNSGGGGGGVSHGTTINSSGFSHSGGSFRH